MRNEVGSATTRRNLDARCAAGSARRQAKRFVPIAGFVVTGTSARIPRGAPVSAFLDEELTIASASGQAPAPMVVPAATAPAVTPAPTAAPAGSIGKR
jgi:hypothetical protein